MTGKAVAAILAWMALHSTTPILDVNLTIIEYRVLPQVGQVRLTTGHVHDPAIQKAMLTDLASFDRQGIVLLGGDTVRRINRRKTIGSHTVETTLSVYPATGHGYRGGLATAAISVTVDGRLRVDAPYDSGPAQLADIEIQPLDGMISILGSYDDKIVRGTISLDGNEDIDTKWLAQHAR